MNATQANTSIYSVSADVSGVLPVRVTYDVSVKVEGTIYLVRYTTPAGEIAPKYAAGRELLVLVGKNTITYNDLLGRSLQVPIESHRPATEPKHSK